MGTLLAIGLIAAVTLAVQPWVRRQLRRDHRRCLPGLFILQGPDGHVRAQRSRHIPGDQILVAEEVALTMGPLLSDDFEYDMEMDARRYLIQERLTFGINLPRRLAVI